MKNILTLIIIVILTLFSCTDRNSVEISKEEYDKLKGIPKVLPKPFTFDASELVYHGSGIVKGSDKHEYLITNYLCDYQGIEHYIDCEYCLTRNKK